MEPRGLRVALRIWVGLVLAFLFVPIVLIVLYAFNSSNIESWPISHFSLHWFTVAWHDAQVRSAFLRSVRVGLVATVLARLRRTPGSLAEASMDLGGRGWQTLRFVMLPMTATALVSGALLAFGLSFDEVIVTVFTAGAQNTLPLWIFGAIRLGQQLPEVNAVVSIVILLTIIPVVLAARLAGAGSVSRAGAA